MPSFYPVVIPGGKSLAGDSLGFHAYSLRIDNLTNQWLLEETSLAWIPPYSLGVCLRLYGTGVGIILNQAPVGQVQLAPLVGEQAVGVYSDQLRTEVAGSPVRQYSLVQSVSDLTQGPEPAFPPVGIDRLWADSQGLIHHLHSNGQDTILTDPLQTGVVTAPMLAAGVAAINIGTVGGVLTGTLPNPGLANNSVATANLMQYAVTQGNTNNVGAFSTTSASFVASPLALSFAVPPNTSALIALAQIQWYNTVVGATNGFFLGWDGTAFTGTMAAVNPTANYAAITTFQAIYLNPTAVSHTAQLYYSTNSGTLNVQGSSLTILGMYR